MSGQPKTAALIVAAGRGHRAAGSNGRPKQYLRLGGALVLSRTLAAFDAHPGIDLIQVVIHPDDRSLYDSATAAYAGAKLCPAALGGATRQDSVRKGLAALAPSDARNVLIHDAARPFVSAGIIDNVIAAIGADCGAIAALPLADTLKRAEADGTIAATIDRKGLWQAQTPQGFRLAAILKAHIDAQAAGRADFTDDAALAEWSGLPVRLVPGSAANRKLTTAEDIEMAQRELDGAATAPDIRTGTGFDVHRLVPGDHLWLCGVKLAHDHRLDGHSDADVGLHALTDALLGAIGDGDIGAHFPPSDPQWKGARSDRFLADAARRVAARGGRINNVDVTLLCEAPKIGPHREAMRRAIAAILGIGIDRVGVKATTTEGLGFPGRGEGIAAMATATVILP